MRHLRRMHLCPSRIMGIALLLAPMASAEGDKRRLLLVNTPRELERATQIALGPWDVDVRTTSATSLGAKQPDAMEGAHRLAREQQADVVTWYSQTEDGRSTIWIYDVQNENTYSRAYSSRVSEETAAAVALSIKTLLRASPIAPEHERITTIQTMHPAGRFRLGLDVGARAGFAEVSVPEATLRLDWSPRPLKDHLSVGVYGTLGLETEAQASDRTLRTHGWGTGLYAGARTQVGPMVLAGRLGAGLFVTNLSEDLLGDRFNRVIPVLEGSVSVGAALGTRFEIGLRGGLVVALRPQSYFVGTEEALRVGTMMPQWGGYLSTRIF